MTEEESLKTKLDKIVQKLDEQETKKKFKLPLSVRMSQGNIRRKNHAVIMLIRTNGAVQFKMTKIEDNTIRLNETYHDASADYVLRYKKYPILIIPEWTTEPFSPEENLRKAEKEGTLTAGQRYILAKMKADTIKNKMEFNWKIILILLIVGGAALYLLDYLQIL